MSLTYLRSRGVRSERRGHRVPAALPETFDTPMFWGEEDLAELRGTAVVGPSLCVYAVYIRADQSCVVQTKLEGAMRSATIARS